MLNYMDIPDCVILVVLIISILLTILCVKVYLAYSSVYFLHCRIWAYIFSPFDNLVEHVGGIDIWICDS